MDEIRDILGYLVMIFPCFMAHSFYQNSFCTYYGLKVIEEEKLDNNIARLMHRYLLASALGTMIILGFPYSPIAIIPFFFVEAIISAFWVMFVDSGYFHHPGFDEFMDQAYQDECLDSVHHGVVYREEIPLPDYETFRINYLPREKLIQEHIDRYWRIDDLSRRTFILRITVPRIIFCAGIVLFFRYIRITQLS